MVTADGQVTDKVGAAVTVNVDVQVSDCPQSSFAVNVIFTTPPQKDGASKPLKSVDTVPQPPVVVKPAIQVAKAASTVACVEQAGIVTADGQLTDKVGAAVTVKVEVQVSDCPQSSFAVNVIFTTPPQNDGASKPLKSVDTVPQPPVVVKPAIQVAKAASTVACVEQAGMVTAAGQVTDKVGAAVTINVDVQVWDCPQLSLAV